MGSMWIEELHKFDMQKETGASVVLQLSEKFESTCAKLHFGNFFASYALLILLKAKKKKMLVVLFDVIDKTCQWIWKEANK